MVQPNPSEDPAGPSGPLAPADLGFTAKIAEAAQTSRWARAGVAFVSSAVSIGLLTLAALVTSQPLIFPSLGPTAYVLFDRPHSASAAPRTVFVGQLISVVAGYLSLVAFGLRHAPSTLQGGVNADRIGATALALGLTAAAMVLAGAWHAPAGATTLIVSLGLLTSPAHLGVLMAAVVLLIIQGVVLDKLGLGLPTWRPPPGRRRRPKGPSGDAATSIPV